jgi:hypothetical protein
MILKKIRGKKGIAMSFNWIFAIIAGGFILFLAVFSAGKFIRTSEQVLYTETAATIKSLTDPLVTGLASGKANRIEFQKKSKIFMECEEGLNLPWGKQTIAFSEQTFGDKFSEKGQEVTIKDKYIFSDNVIEGKNMYFFSKPFFMPFKVMDQIIMVSEDDQYCFFDTPEYFQESIEGLNLPNMIFMNGTNECEGKNICFGDSQISCETKVFEELGYMLKKESGKRVYFAGDLVYGAVFSEPNIYECNVKRIKVKFDNLAQLYLDKIQIIERKGCESNIAAKLGVLLGGIQDSRGLIGLYAASQDINSINRQARTGCQLYYNNNFE